MPSFSRRVGSSAQIRSKTDAGASRQDATSALVRAQPPHRPVVSSIRQNPIQGLGVNMIIPFRALRVKYVQLFLLPLFLLNTQFTEIVAVLLRKDPVQHGI
jgi:hypothetical protein